MTDKLIAYCPEIKFLSLVYLPVEEFRQDLIAAALTRRIKRRGEWDEFCSVTHDNTLSSDGDFWLYDVDSEEHWIRFFAWLTDPATLIRVVGEWGGRVKKYDQN